MDLSDNLVKSFFPLLLFFLFLPSFLPSLIFQYSFFFLTINSGIRSINDQLSSPSEFCKSKDRFPAIIGEGINCVFQTHRAPAGISGISSIFLHSKTLGSIFDWFRDANYAVDETDILDSIKVSKLLTETYNYETERRTNLYHWMAGYFKQPDVTVHQEAPIASKSIEKSNGSEVKADILVNFTPGEHQHNIPLLLTEVKNELGINGDPTMELAAYVMKFTASQSFLETTSCPMLLLAISGPYGILFGSVFTGKHYLFDHITTISFLYSPESPILIREQARFWRILKDGTFFLRKEQEEMVRPNPRRPFTPWKPYFSSFNYKGNQFSLEYTDCFKERDYVFKAKAKTEGRENREVVVKFTQTYSRDLHELLAQENLAPKVLAFEELHAGWKVAVMDYIKEGEAFPIGEGTEEQRKKLDQVLSLMQGEGRKWVHGDLRSQNVLVQGEDVFVIDFEFGGKEEEAKYPFNLSNGPLEYQKVGAKPQEMINQEHDRKLIHYLKEGEWN